MPKDLFQGVKINDSKFVLNGSDHHHCSRVTRHKVADHILVSDFDGFIYNAKIHEISSDSTFLNVESIYSTEAKSPRISIAISPTQQMDRFEWFVEKAVECGVQ
jgi:16S rRNA (uracil1498-N3)-methyltransferase